MSQPTEKNYENYVSRNLGYIDLETQKQIQSSKLLIAGCGIGSQVAEALARMGFENFTLVDGDTVDIPNLNRQSFFSDQVGLPKTEALAQNLQRIRPSINVKSQPQNLTEESAGQLVSECDLVFDTIDFLDLNAIVALHDAANQQGRTVFSTFSVGFGAALIYLPPQPDSHAVIRDIFKLPKSGPLGSASYVAGFIELFTRLAPSIDPQVVQAMQKVFKAMADGEVCPAPQVSPGAHSVAALACTAVANHLSGRAISHAPCMLVDNLQQVIQQTGVRLVE